MSETPELPEFFTLSSGRKIPSIGLGTFQGNAGNDQVRSIVHKALKQGYRHIDTAADYGNEKQVGEAIKECGVARTEIFVTTKLWGQRARLDQPLRLLKLYRANHWHEPGNVEEALDTSLRNLQLEYVDLFLMHCMQRLKHPHRSQVVEAFQVPYAYATSQNHDKLRHVDGKPLMDFELSRQYPAVWKAMEALVDSGKALAIGLSNFNILKIKRILERARIKPAVNQVELHPYLPQTELVNFCKAEGIVVTAHQPLGGKPLGVVNPHIGKPGPLADSEIARIAAESGKTVAQTILAWNVTRGVSVIPKTAREDRLWENLNLAGLSMAHMKKIQYLSQIAGPVRFLDPKEHVGFDVFDEEKDQPIQT